MVKFIEKKYFTFVMFVGILSGGLLRLYRIRSQLIWDDEWHGIYTAIINPLGYIFTHYHDNDNCIPLSIYYRIMLNFNGLNETIVRFPQILSGILILVVFPLIARKSFNKRTALTFSFMLAISPLLIYFGRFARPYGIVVFLSFVSIFSFYFWVNERKPIYAVAYLISAVLAPYFSLSSLVFVIAPVVYFGILSQLKRKAPFIRFAKNIPERKHIIFFVLALAVGIGLWLAPAVGTIKEVTNKSGQSLIDLGTLGGCAFLFCGSNSYVLCSILAALFIYGLFVLYAYDKSLFSYLCTICLSQLLFIVLSRPRLVQVTIVFARYFLPVLPVFLLIISLALSELHIKLPLFQNKPETARRLANLIVALLLVFVFLNGPLPDAYGFPNDFTNHIDYQYKYVQTPGDMRGAHELTSWKFYLILGNQKNKGTVIEFPAVVSWTWNIFHIYQRVHKNRVVIGYDSNHYGPFFGYDSIHNKHIEFTNFVDVSSAQPLVNSGADFIVLHKNIWKESAAVGLHSPDNRRKMEKRLFDLSPSVRAEMADYVSDAIANLGARFGVPFYEDEWIVVYKVK